MSDQAKLKILILERDQDFIEGIQNSMGDRECLVVGHTIDSTNRDHLSRIILDTCPDIVALNLDIDSEDKSAESVKEIRMVPVSPPAKILAYTGSDSKSLKTQVFKAGVDEFMTKPFTWQDVWFRLDIVIRNRILQIELDESARKLSVLNKKLLEANAKLETMTITDELTGLSNMRYMSSRLEEMFSSVRRNHFDIAVMMIDLDSFKQVNDNNDHLVGSEMIKRVGHIIKDQLRDVDLKARYGGDEYIVVLPLTPVQDANIVAERIRKAVSEIKVEFSGTPVNVTASIGLAAYDKDKHKTYKDLIRDADAALYASKHNGKNRVTIFDGSVDKSYDESQSAIFTEIKKNTG